MTYFSINPKDLYLTGSESLIIFKCELSTDLPYNNWTFGWSDGHENLATESVKNGKLFTINNTYSTFDPSFAIGTTLAIRIMNSTSLFTSSIPEQFYCYAFNSQNNMKLNSRIGHLYNLGM